MSHNMNFRMGAPMGRGKRLGTAYAFAASSSAEGDIMEGLREDDADVRLRGLREDDADVRMRGLREDDADVRMRGLREDDADVRMGDVDTLSAEGGRIEQEQPGMDGLREDDADVRMGDLEDTTRWDGATGRAEGSAEGHRDYQMGLQPSVMVSNGRVGFTVGTSYAPAAEGSAEGDILGVSAYDEMGVSAYDEMGRRRKVEVGVSAYDELGVSAYDELSGLREDDADVRMMGLREDDADVRMRGLREDDASVRMGDTHDEEMGVSAYDEMGRRRRVSPGKRHLARRRKMLRGAEEEPPKLGAEGFHERFPVTVEIKGLGRIDTALRGGDIVSGVFDFLRPLPSDEEYLGKIKIILTQWDQIKPELMGLHEQSRVAITNNMKAADADIGRYESMRGFLAEGAGAKTLGRWDRVKRLETYLPTLRTLIAQAKALGPAPNMPAEQKRTNEQAITDVSQRQQAVSKPNVFVDTILPIGAVAGGTAAVTGLLLAVL